MNSGVYQIMNMRNYHMYIGSTNDFDARWSYHRFTLRKGTHSNIHLQRAWNKEGEDLFEFSVVEYVDEGPEAWVAREQYYTDLWNPEYAIRKECVASNFKCQYTDEARQNMRAAAKERCKIKENHSMYGKPRSEETKRKCSESQKGEKSFMFGKHLSAETKRKCSISKKEYWAQRRRNDGIRIS